MAHLRRRRRQQKASSSGSGGAGAGSRLEADRAEVRAGRGYDVLQVLRSRVRRLWARGDEDGAVSAVTDGLSLFAETQVEAGAEAEAEAGAEAAGARCATDTLQALLKSMRDDAEQEAARQASDANQQQQQQQQQQRAQMTARVMRRLRDACVGLRQCDADTVAALLSALEVWLREYLSARLGAAQSGGGEELQEALRDVRVSLAHALIDGGHGVRALRTALKTGDTHLIASALALATARGYVDEEPLFWARATLTLLAMQRPEAAAELLGMRPASLRGEEVSPLLNFVCMMVELATMRPQPPNTPMIAKWMMERYRTALEVDRSLVQLVAQAAPCFGAVVRTAPSMAGNPLAALFGGGGGAV